jgi:exosome complex RNA-binding protein Rrp4
LSKLGDIFRFEINIGYNGRIWINSDRPNNIIFIMNALERYIELGEGVENADKIL